MKSGLFITLGSLIFVLTSFSFGERPTVPEFQANEVDTTKSYLYLYGEYIYKRENCGSCHTLKINEGTEKISLDGIAGKYSPSWHYYHLEDPEVITYKSKMPSFHFLTDQLIQKDSVEKHLGTLSAQDWEKLTKESRELELQLIEARVKVKPKVEIIALIHFLNNLPMSDAYRVIANKISEKIERERKKSDSLWAISDTLIFLAINDKASIARGSSIYRYNCVACHGNQGEGGIGPNLTDKYWLHGGSDRDLINTLVEGLPDKGMKSWKNDFSPVQVGQLIAFLKSIRGSNPENAKAAQGKKS